MELCKLLKFHLKKQQARSQPIREGINTDSVLM